MKNLEAGAADELQRVIAFLLGEGPLDGMHFGDSDTARPRKPYWWRKHLRAAWAAQTDKQQEQNSAASASSPVLPGAENVATVPNGIPRRNDAGDVTGTHDKQND